MITKNKSKSKDLKESINKSMKSVPSHSNINIGKSNATPLHGKLKIGDIQENRIKKQNTVVDKNKRSNSKNNLNGERRGSSPFHNKLANTLNKQKIEPNKVVGTIKPKGRENSKGNKYLVSESLADISSQEVKQEPKALSKKESKVSLKSNRQNPKLKT